MKNLFLLLSLLISFSLTAATRPVDLGDATARSIAVSGIVTAENLSGNNTGDETAATIIAKLSYTPLPNTAAAIAAALGYTPMADTAAAIAAALGYTPVNPASLSTVATSGSYDDLTSKPTLGSAAALDVGTSPGNVVRLDPSTGKLPAVDGSNLTNLPGSSGGTWGGITGTLSDQTDLQNALNAKADSSILATVATSGSYDDLASKPTLGSAAVLDAGTSPGNVLRLDPTTGKMPAVDGSNLTNLPSGGSDLPMAADVTDNGLPFNVPSPQGGNDSYTKLLVNFNGNATDSAYGATEPHTPTNTGVSFVTGKFSQGGNFGAAYEVTYPGSADFNMPGDFTIDFWHNPASTGDSGLFTLTDGSTYGLTLFVYSNALKVIGSGSYIINGTAGVTASTFQHIALVRNSGTLTLYKNGTSIGSTTYATSLTSTGNLRIGYTAAIPAYCNGIIDEFRISQYARWTTNFTPPSVAYSITAPEWSPAIPGTPSSSSEIIFRDPVDSALKYAAASAFPYLVNPMTTVGDMIVGGASGAPTRVAAGTNGYVWTAQGAGAAPVWAAATGVGKVIVSGNGYILDNGSIGRGTIGAKAVSLNYADYGTGYGAIGDYSGVLSGQGNKCDGNYSVIAGGGGHISDYSNTINSIATYSFIGSGVANIANATVTTISGGSNNKTNAQYSSIPGGLHALTSNYAEFSIASGYFAEIGDCQRGSIQARKSTSSTDSTILYLDGNNSNQSFLISAGDSYTCRITIFAKQTDGSCGDAIYQVKVKNVSGTTSLSGTVRSILAWEGDTNLGSPTIAITADDTNDALIISVTPANATATRWTATIDYVKINY